MILAGDVGGTSWVVGEGAGGGPGGAEASEGEATAAPIAAGQGAGGEVRRPLGMCIIGGLVFSQLITLYLTPTVYLYLGKFQSLNSDRVPVYSTEEELAPWVARIQHVSETGDSTFVITNNHFEGKGIVNALQLVHLLTHAKVKVPEPLRQRYPELESIANEPPAEPLLFPT